MAAERRLSLQEIESYDPSPYRAGDRLRARCPVHGGDRQRSLSVDLARGLYHCFQCQASGILVERLSVHLPAWQPSPSPRTPLERPVGGAPGNESESPTKGLVAALERAQEAFLESPAMAYCESRGIPPNLAWRYGAGYTERWAGWPDRRVIFPLSDLYGLRNVYARSLDPNAPKAQRHRFLPGPKGLFNASALGEWEAVFITEGVFDALSLIAAGYPNTVALCGVADFRLGWFQRQQRLQLCLDADDAGKAGLREIARQAIQRGMTVTYLPAATLGAFKDLNACWMATGKLALGPL